MVQWLLSNFQNFLFQIEKLLSQKAKLLNFFIHIINRAIKNCFGPDCAAKFVQWQWMNYSSKQRQPSRVFSLSIYLDVYGTTRECIVVTPRERMLHNKEKLYWHGISCQQTYKTVKIISISCQKIEKLYKFSWTKQN